MQTSRWPISKLPIAHLEPFPYHKGELYVELLDRLAKYVTDQLHPNLRKTVEHMVEEMEHILALQHGKYVEGIQDFQRIHDAFMEDVNSALMALNDNAVSDLADDPGSVFGQKLRELFSSRTDFDALTDEFNALAKTSLQLADTTTYWVRPDGDDNADGTQNSPLATIREAIDRSNGLSFTAGAELVVKLFPGVYTESLVVPHTSTPIRLHIMGHPVGHPNRPLTRFQYDGNRVQAITNTAPGTVVTISDVQYQGYRGTGTDAAISCTRNHLYTQNVHIDDCGSGIIMQNGNLDIKGGIIENCGTGIRSYMVSRHAIGTQNAGNRSNGPFIRNCNTGVSVGEASSGHVDWAVIEDCRTGLSLDRNAALNPAGTGFYRNEVGISLSNGAACFTSNNDFGTGDDANGRSVNVTSGAHLSSNEMWTSIVTMNSLDERIVRDVTSTPPLEGVNDENVTERLGSALLKSAWWNDESNGSQPDKAYIIRAYGTAENTNSIEMRLILGSGSLHPTTRTLFDSFEGGDFEVEATVKFLNRETQHLQVKLFVDGQHPKIVNRVASVDMSQDQNVYLQARVYGGEASGTTLDIHSTEVWMR